MTTQNNDCFKNGIHLKKILYGTNSQNPFPGRVVRLLSLDPTPRGPGPILSLRR